MSLHVEKCHHRPRVQGIHSRVWNTKGSAWFATCATCGWWRGLLPTQHAAFVAALAHAEESLR